MVRRAFRVRRNMSGLRTEARQPDGCERAAVVRVVPGQIAQPAHSPSILHNPSTRDEGKSLKKTGKFAGLHEPPCGLPVAVAVPFCPAVQRSAHTGCDRGSGCASRSDCTIPQVGSGGVERGCDGSDGGERATGDAWRNLRPSAGSAKACATPHRETAATGGVLKSQARTLRNPAAPPTRAGRPVNRRTPSTLRSMPGCVTRSVPLGRRNSAGRNSAGSNAA